MQTPIERIVNKTFESLKPPPKLKLSEWAERYGYLPAESSAEPGRWHNIPYQVGIMDAISDPRIERVTVIKSARIGYTKLIGHAIGFYAHYDPCPLMVVQPTEADAEGYSKEEIAPMLRDTPALKGLFQDPKTRDSGNTILQKIFPGGSLSLVGANSPRGFRRVSRRVVIFDEVDGYPPTAGAEGDQIKLGIKRTEYYWNRKIIAGSTPTTSVMSRIEPMFQESDRRYYNVPCPHCGEFQVLKFPNLKWPDGKPELAHFVCEKCSQPIHHNQKRWMVERGKWIAEGETKNHAGFHIWAAYSYSPNATWADIAKEFLDAKKQGQETLKTFVNTTLGEVWTEKGEAPEWERLYRRRETYEIGTVPHGVGFLTAGVDVQGDRIEAEVVGWCRDKSSYSIEYRVFYGDTSSIDSKVWSDLDELLHKEYISNDGQIFEIKTMAIDSGFNTQRVYEWARKYPMTKVMAIKGQDNSQHIVSTPKLVDLTVGGKRIRNGLRLWSVGSSLLKSELYSWLKLEAPLNPDDPYPSGFCHFPQYDEEYFKMLTAEQLNVRVVKGYRRYEWQKVRDRNEALDVRIYARAAAYVVGMDRFNSAQWDKADVNHNTIKKPEPEKQIPAPIPVKKPSYQMPNRRKPSFL